MRKILSLLAVTALLALSGVARAQSPPTASAELIDKKGHIVGNATFIQEPGGVRMFVHVKGLAPGKHGIHIHETGRVDPPDFKTAGGHLNPEHHQHGLANPQGHHLGDLPNLVVREYTGYTSQEFWLSGATLYEGKDSLMKPGGTALVIHAKEDDEKTDPSGNSGDRVVAGLIRKQ